MNLFRDPRWGRGQEVPGEDPVLTSEYVKHFSQGLMHGDTDHVDVDPDHLQIISTCKHFAGCDTRLALSHGTMWFSPGWFLGRYRRIISGH
jgi:beta-D-xylosidase 4